MTEVVVREASPDDAEALVALIRALAVFEKAPDAVKASAEDLRKGMTGARPAFECLIAEVDGRPAGFALWFHNFSTWEGKRGIYLEDIFVEEWARGLGLGKRLMRELARIALARDCKRLDLWVLHWNPARKFYESLGMAHMEDWLPYRIDGANLKALAGG